MSAATEVARRISRSATPDVTCRLLVEYANAQTAARDGDDPILLAALRADLPTLAEARTRRTGVAS